MKAKLTRLNIRIDYDLKDKIEIVRPKETFSIAPGKKRKKVVVLRTKEKLAKALMRQIF